MAHSIGHNRLKSFVERIERLKDEQDALGKDIRAIYAEAHSDGIDKTALGQVVTIRRKREKGGQKYQSVSALVELYLDTLDNGSEKEHARAHAHEAPSTDNPNPASTTARAGEADGTGTVPRTASPNGIAGGVRHRSDTSSAGTEGDEDRHPISNPDGHSVQPEGGADGFTDPQSSVAPPNLTDDEPDIPAFLDRRGHG